MQLTVSRVFCIVTAAALGGMVMGGLFGYGAGLISPEVFIMTFKTVPNDPLPTAVLLGAFGGVMCGGLLGVFSIVANLAWMWLKLKQNEVTIK